MHNVEIHAIMVNLNRNEQALELNYNRTKEAVNALCMFVKNKNLNLNVLIITSL